MIKGRENVELPESRATSLTAADFDGYFCVFVGSPKLCLPYCLFASQQQAKLFRDELGKRKYPIITLRQWLEVARDAKDGPIL